MALPGLVDLQVTHPTKHLPFQAWILLEGALSFQ